GQERAELAFDRVGIANVAHGEERGAMSEHAAHPADRRRVDLDRAIGTIEARDLAVGSRPAGIAGARHAAGTRRLDTYAVLGAIRLLTALRQARLFLHDDLLEAGRDHASRGHLVEAYRHHERIVARSAGEHLVRGELADVVDDDGIVASRRAHA